MVFVVQGLEDCTLSVHALPRLNSIVFLLFFSPLGVSSTYLGRASSFTLGFFSLAFPDGAAAVCFACFSANLRAFSALARSFATALCQIPGLPDLLVRLRTLFLGLLLLGCLGVTAILTGGILALGILLSGREESLSGLGRRCWRLTTHGSGLLARCWCLSASRLDLAARKRSSRMLCDAALRAIFAKPLVRFRNTGRTTEALLYSALESILMVWVESGAIAGQKCLTHQK